MRTQLSRLCTALAVAVLLPSMAWAQLTTGMLEFAIADCTTPGNVLHVRGSLGFSRDVHPGSDGVFRVVLPYGTYRVSRLGGVDVEVYVAPLQTVRIGFFNDSVVAATPFTDRTHGDLYPGGISLQNMLTRAPATIAWPVDFTGLDDNRLALASQRAASWTTTQFQFLGMNATDAYQPGHTVLLPDLRAMDAVVVRSGLTLTGSTADGTEVGVFPSQPGATWHLTASTAGTGLALASSNLPPVGERGLLQQNQQYQWLTRESLQAGGPLGRHADLMASLTTQWSSQTVPQAAPGTDQQTSMTFANVRGRYRAGEHDQIDALFSGSRMSISNYGMPLGLEALTGHRMAPPLLLLDGFAGQKETDNMGFLQAGWDHRFSESSILQVRYGYAPSRLNAQATAAGQSRTELLTGLVTGAPPMSNNASRTRQELRGVWQFGARHRVTVSGGYSHAVPVNRFAIPSNLNLVTAGGAPAFAVEYNTPTVSRPRIGDATFSVADHFALTDGLSIDASLLSDFSRGGPVSWNGLAPRVSLAWAVPHFNRMVLRAGYFRTLSPLAGRYLDFADPASLSGSMYQWTDRNSDGQFQPGEEGPLILRFGGAWSSIAPSLQRPYADQVHFQAQIDLGHGAIATAGAFRRDDKRRIAALDVGVSAGAFTPIAIPDPFSVTPLTVYQQNPATFGQDRYLLTNPAGLRSFSEGFTAEIDQHWRRLALHLAFTAEKSYGPNNPGNSVLDNDPGVIGALFSDPNANVNNSGRNLLDPGYIGRIQGTYRLPYGLELSSTADYSDGLTFARELPVYGLAQGPFLAPAVVREGVTVAGGELGYRTLFVANWNVRLLRQFHLSRGTLAAYVDVLNVLNGGNAYQQNPLQANLRQPLALQEPRWLELHLRYQF